MRLEPANVVCPKCRNGNYMRYLIGKGVGRLNMKCINCNAYFNSDELRKQAGGEIVAEFQEVLRQWRRMCQCHNCKECPGRTIGNKDIICILTKTENRRTEAEVEEIITAWASDHPEPVYPTWGEWFVKQSGFAEGWKNATDPAWEANTAIGMFRMPIPANIAERLGIKPKEDA